VPARIRCLLLVFLLLACSPEDPGTPSPPELPPVSEFVRNGTSLYSQGPEELIVRDFFGDRREGVFLDVGAATPIENSTTYYLEHHLGWSGIAIDALPDYAPAWAEKRSRSKYLQLLVSDHVGEPEAFYRAHIERFRGLSSTQAEREVSGMTVTGDELLVPTATLDAVLEAHGIERIDFLSLDIEGAEPKALAGFDIERFRPALVCIEAGAPTKEFSRKYFPAHGYARIDRYLRVDPYNWYFEPVQ
jgi:FkbM family methyltransferase